VLVFCYNLSMKIIVGLGNPGNKYENTRHNVGFMAVDFILHYGDVFMTEKPSHEFKSEMHTWGEGEKKLIFLKPQTFMNDSGLALKLILNFYKVDIANDLLVIHDEVDLPLGVVKLSKDSSAAGHNGVQSVINELGTQNFNRLRVGVETRASRAELPTDAFVLQNFSEDELRKVKEGILPQVRLEVEKFVGLGKWDFDLANKTN
jgi:PTH1 family peptidyl-tRNA hydrolase